MQTRETFLVTPNIETHETFHCQFFFSFTWSWDSFGRNMNEFSRFINQQSKSSAEFHHIYFCRQEKSAFKTSNIKLYVQCRIWNSYNQQTCETQHTGIIDTKAIFFMSRGRLPIMSKKQQVMITIQLEFQVSYIQEYSLLLCFCQKFSISPNLPKTYKINLVLKPNMLQAKFPSRVYFEEKCFPIFKCLFVCKMWLNLSNFFCSTVKF